MLRAPLIPSYAIAACAAYYELTSDPESLELAKKALLWLNFAHDQKCGGYFSLMQRDGTLITSSDPNSFCHADRDCIGTPIGLKDANTNGDMLDALSDLYRAWPDPTVNERLIEMLEITRDRMVVAPGAFHMYFQPDWSPVPDFNRYGYGLNGSNILSRAARCLFPGGDVKTESVIKSVLDTVLRYGWDNAKGGVYYGGSTFGPTYIEDMTVFLDGKYYWVQAEGMQALLRLALAFPDDERNYLQRFQELWTYIQDNIIDRERGGWLLTGRDSSDSQAKPKGTVWKEPSHEIYSLLECIRLLKSEP